VAYKVIAAIVGKLQDEDSDVRQTALISLVELAKHSKSVHLATTCTKLIAEQMTFKQELWHLQ
jgi:hypothetical protein